MPKTILIHSDQLVIGTRSGIIVVFNQTVTVPKWCGTLSCGLVGFTSNQGKLQFCVKVQSKRRLVDD